MQPRDELPTVVAVPRFGAAGDGAPTPATAPPRDTLQVRTPVEALHLDEARRTLLVTAFIYVLVVAEGGATILLGGDPTYRAIHLAGLGVAAIAATWVVIVARDAARYRTFHVVLLGHACLIAVTTAYPYWGTFSAALMVVPLGALIFTFGQSLAGAASIIVVAMGSHATLSVLTIAGALPDRGLIRLATHLTATEQILILVLVQFIFVASFFLARRIRSSTQEAFERLDVAVRELSQRDAILGEARLDLRDILQLGGLGGYSEQVVGDFRIGVVLGRGAMGEVYEAQRISTGEPCAIKLLHQHAIQNDVGALRRFQREAQIAASLDVPNVVRVVAVSAEGEKPPYLAMERLEGADLAARLKDHPVMPLGEVIDLVRQLGAGLEAARRVGIVHRDLKPQNVFGVAAGEDGTLWKILDFGMSKLAGRHHGTLTRGHIVGTPGYMSPEQARGDDVDHRSDLYALGVISYRALTGRPVVAAADVPRMLFDIVYRLPPAPSTLVRVPAELDLVLAVALAKHPRDRFDSGIELAAQLAAAAVGTLHPDVTQRARALLARHPWGVVSRA